MNVTHRKFLILTALTLCWNTVEPFPAEWEKKLGQCTKDINAINDALEKGEFLIDGSQKMDQCIRIISDINRQLKQLRATERTENTQLTHSQEIENTTPNLKTHNDSWRALIPEIKNASQLFEKLELNLPLFSSVEYSNNYVFKEYYNDSVFKNNNYLKMYNQKQEESYLENLNTFIQRKREDLKSYLQVFSKILNLDPVEAEKHYLNENVVSDLNYRNPRLHIALLLGYFYRALIQVYISFIKRNIYCLTRVCGASLSQENYNALGDEMPTLFQSFETYHEKDLQLSRILNLDTLEARREMALNTKKRIGDFNTIIPVVKKIFEFFKKNNKKEESNKCYNYAEDGLQKLFDITQYTEQISAVLNKLEPELEKF
ncbi:hypothetical protein [Holospora curviuscula]|uniref:Uncharacterized protein n=1 Tax=Holospora curviuscula TaxID=1082868 RepID=A0A2S5R9G5_9PROT|nr:hypothetical protein [Holospora curviuscula]PPE03966.1 hypothetical protein HCUR_00501 [Holospora curviuscula]